MRKRLEMQEALKRPQKIKKKLRLFITNSFSPANPADQNHQTGSWELRVEGRLLGIYLKKLTVTNKKLRAGGINKQ
jgi:SWI/SNF-related matrix-associated actin-dependent regulator of chromatin subfamily D